MLHNYRALGVTMCLSLAVSSATAEDISIEGRTHLALESRLFAVGSFDVEGERATTAAYGYPFAPQVRVGYGVVNKCEFGGTFALAVGDDYDTDVSDIALGGYVRWVAPGERTRFFLGPTLSLRRLATTYNDTDETVSALQAGMGVDAGFYTFAAPSFSIDPSLSLRYLTGGADSDSGARVDVSGWRLDLSIAFSGWLGGGRPAIANNPY
jgi:hypothetical protein